MANSSDTPRDSEAFEMIELAIDEIDLLTRAFDVINQWCEEEAEGVEVFEPQPCAKLVLH